MFGFFDFIFLNVQEVNILKKCRSALIKAFKERCCGSDNYPSNSSQKEKRNHKTKRRTRHNPIFSIFICFQKGRSEFVCFIDFPLFFSLKNNQKVFRIQLPRYARKSEPGYLRMEYSGTSFSSDMFQLKFSADTVKIMISVNDE